MSALLLSFALGAAPTFTVVELLPGPERLSLITASQRGPVQLDQAQPVLALALLGEVGLDVEKPLAICGAAGRCEPGLTLDFGAQLLVLQPDTITASDFISVDESCGAVPPAGSG